MFSSEGVGYKTDKYYLTNLTEAVYLTEVPGEGGLIMDKLPQTVKDSLVRTDAEERTDGYENYYALKYVDMVYAFMYNADLFEQFNLPLPVTTTEFSNVCDIIEDTGYSYTVDGKTTQSNTSLMVRGKHSYIQHAFPMYWAQYEGIDKYEDYFKGQVNGRVSNEITQQKGRLRALDQMEDILQNHSYEYVGSVEYLDAQSRFLGGEGIFHWNGDYFTTEMALTRKANKDKGISYDIRTFAAPVISSIVEKLSFYDEPIQETPEYPYASCYQQKTPYKELAKSKQEAYDAVLATVIREIDAGVSFADSTAKSLNGYTVSQSDWDIIKAAREIKANRQIPAQEAVIPSNTPAKELAADFLRFMYTDIAIENFSKCSGGISFPALYYGELNETEFEAATEGLETEAKTKFELLFKKNAKHIPAENQFLFGKAGLKKLMYSGNLGLAFSSTEANRDTAKKLFEADIAHWSGDTWTSLCQIVGV